jgi:hypothetical protein
MTGGPSDWAEAYMSDEQILAKRRDWAEKFRPALKLALEEFVETTKWPERERFRRRLVQRGLKHISLDEMLRDMPRSPGVQVMVVPDRVVLSMQVLLELPEAGTLLDVCMAMVRRAYELYCSDSEDDPQILSDDPVIVSAANGDASLLLRAREVLNQNPPDPLGGGTGGIDSTAWYRTLNDAVMPAFSDVVTIGDYFDAQRKITEGDHSFYGRGSTLVSPPPGVTVKPQGTASAGPSGGDIFVIMPFSEPWSAGIYAFVRRAFAKLESPDELRLYRADEIADPGQISDQIRKAIESARVVIADVTGMNPNVMWELGYADGLSKAIVILNQAPGSSPFDIADRRQVAYKPSPTDSDEEDLVRHLEKALGIGR